jgi:parallel beta-helix repeat protein
MQRISLVVALLGAVVLAVTGIASADTPVGPPCAFTTKNATMTLNADCTTTTTINVPNGVTLDGKGHRITAVDPVGGAFTGAVVANGGAVMNVQNLTIVGSSNVVDNCRDFNGVAFLAASGSITNVALSGIGLPNTGCQIGRAILVNSIGSATRQSVKIENNVVSNYNKDGIDVRGNVDAKIDGNTVTGSPSDLIIRNGIEVLTGASAQVWSNTVSGNHSDAFPLSDTGLLVLDGATVNLTKANTLTGNDVSSDIEGSTIVGKYKVSP